MQIVSLEENQSDAIKIAMTINELYSRIVRKNQQNDKENQRIDAFELDKINNEVLLERLEKIERKILENKFIVDRFKVLGKDPTIMNPKQYAEVMAQMQTQTKGLNYIDAVQKIVN